MEIPKDAIAFLAQYLDDSDPFSFGSSLEPIVEKPYIYSVYSPLSQLLHELHHLLGCPLQLEDCTLQLLKFNGAQGDYGPYLDLELSIEEQWYNFESFGQDKRDVLIIRTQLCIRVKAIVEKLLSSSGVELSRVVSSLKQIFQDDKDLVHEFVESGGLDAMVTIGHQCDESNHYHILRALGQIMLYIDGMTGIGKHKATIEWLYSLLTSKHRSSVVKNAAKLLVIFVEYDPANGELFMKAVSAVSVRERQPQWSHVMSLLKDSSLTEEIYYVLALKLVNSCLAYLPDQEAYYDLVDMLEEQGMMHALETLQPRAKQSEELRHQIDLYETTLKLEDGEIAPGELPPSSNLLPTLRRNKQTAGVSGGGDKRQSRRRSVHDVAMTTAAAAASAIASAKSDSQQTPGSPLVVDKRSRTGGDPAAAVGSAATALSATKKVSVHEVKRRSRITPGTGGGSGGGGGGTHFMTPQARKARNRTLQEELMARLEQQQQQHVASTPAGNGTGSVISRLFPSSSGSTPQPQASSPQRPRGGVSRTPSYRAAVVGPAGDDVSTLSHSKSSLPLRLPEETEAEAEAEAHVQADHNEDDGKFDRLMSSFYASQLDLTEPEVEDDSAAGTAKESSDRESDQEKAVESLQRVSSAPELGELDPGGDSGGGAAGGVVETDPAYDRMLSRFYSCLEEGPSDEEGKYPSGRGEPHVGVNKEVEEETGGGQLDDLMSRFYSRQEQSDDEAEGDKGRATATSTAAHSELETAQGCVDVGGDYDAAQSLSVALGPPPSSGGSAVASVKASSDAPGQPPPPKVVRPKTDLELLWEALEEECRRSHRLHVKDRDFADLHSSDEEDITRPKIVPLSGGGGGRGGSIPPDEEEMLDACLQQAKAAVPLKERRKSKNQRKSLRHRTLLIGLTEEEMATVKAMAHL